MKTLKFICIALVLFTNTSNAQITKGNWMVGGYVNFTSTKSETKFNGTSSESRGSGLLISPTLGYFVIDKLAFGLNTTYSLSLPSSGKGSSAYGLGPLARYYFLKPEKTINILSQVSYAYTRNSSGAYSNNYSFKAGPVVYFNSSVGLEFTIDYSNSNSITQTSETISNGINVGFGLQIHFEKGKY